MLRTAKGCHRIDGYAVHPSTAQIMEALTVSVKQLPEGWIRANAEQRAVLLDLYGLSDLPSRRS
jgi:hypothetical protein